MACPHFQLVYWGFCSWASPVRISWDWAELYFLVNPVYCQYRIEDRISRACLNSGCALVVSHCMYKQKIFRFVRLSNCPSIHFWQFEFSMRTRQWARVLWYDKSYNIGHQSQTQGIGLDSDWRYCTWFWLWMAPTNCWLEISVKNRIAVRTLLFYIELDKS